MTALRKCAKCNAYSLGGFHCDSATRNPHPARFSLEKFAKYRRIIKGKKD